MSSAYGLWISIFKIQKKSFNSFIFGRIRYPLRNPSYCESLTCDMLFVYTKLAKPTGQLRTHKDDQIAYFQLNARDLTEMQIAQERGHFLARSRSAMQ